MKHERLKFRMKKLLSKVGNLGVLCEKGHINASESPGRVRVKNQKATDI